MTRCAAPPFLCSGSDARARPFLVRRVRRQEVLGHTLDNGQKCLVLPSITYDELLAPVRV